MTQREEAYSPQSRTPKVEDVVDGGALRDVLIGVVGLVVVCCVLLVAAVGMYQMVYAERIYLGVSSMGVDLGGKTPSQVRAQLQAKFDQYAATPLTLRDGSKQLRTTPSEIGLRFDASRAVNDSLGAGRSGGFFEQLFDQLVLWRQGRKINVTFSVEEQPRDTFFARLSRQIDQQVADARLVVQPDLKIRVVPSQPGRKLDTVRVAKQMEQAFATLSTREIDLPVEELTPQVVESGVQEAKTAGEKMLSAPLTLKFGDRKWTLEPKDIHGMILFNLQNNPVGGARLVASLDQSKVQAFVNEIAKDIDVKPQNARFSYKGGRLTPIRESSDGRKLEIQPTIDAINSRAANDQRSITLPVSTVKPAFTAQDGGKLGIRERIESASTPYAGSIPERKTNVELAASRLNGVVVPPGEIFSFNEQLGPATLEAGFKTAWGIVLRDGNMRTVPAEAGGICQVSTTLFQSVFWAGYQIEERYWHLYWIPKYGKPPKGLQGLDSTVDPPFVDFKFKNNTSYPLLIEAKAEDWNLTFALYGTKPTWQVKVDEPRIEGVVKTTTDAIKEDDPKMEIGKSLWIEEAQDGFKATIVRTVTDGDDVRTLKLVSTYKPSHNVIRVGTKPASKPPDAQLPPAKPAEGQRPAAKPTPTPQPAARPAPGQQPATPTPQPNR